MASYEYLMVELDGKGRCQVWRAGASSPEERPGPTSAMAESLAARGQDLSPAMRAATVDQAEMLRWFLPLSNELGSQGWRMVGHHVPKLGIPGRGWWTFERTFN